MFEFAIVPAREPTPPAAQLLRYITAICNIHQRQAGGRSGESEMSGSTGVEMRRQDAGNCISFSDACLENTATFCRRRGRWVLKK